MKYLVLLALMFALLFAFGPGCNRAAPPSEDSAAEARYVSLGAANTEVLFALGVGDRVVGVDVTSRFPEAATRLPNLGFYARVNAEAVLALRPTHVFAIRGAGPAGVLEQLQRTGVAVHRLDHPDTAAGARARIEALGEATGRTAEASALVETLDSELAAATQGLDKPAASDAARVLFLYVRGKRTLLVGGRDTGADEMITLAGFENAAAALSGFVPLTAEAVIAARPDLILVPEKGLGSVGGIDGLLALPGIAQTPAAARRSVVAMEDLALLGFGPRLGRSVSTLRRRLIEAHAR